MSDKTQEPKRPERHVMMGTHVVLADEAEPFWIDLEAQLKQCRETSQVLIVEAKAKIDALESERDELREKAGLSEVAAAHWHKQCDAKDQTITSLRERVEELGREKRRFRQELQTIAYEPLGAPESTTREAFEIAEGIARAALTPTTGGE